MTEQTIHDWAIKHTMYDLVEAGEIEVDDKEMVLESIKNGSLFIQESFEHMRDDVLSEKPDTHTFYVNEDFESKRNNFLSEAPKKDLITKKGSDEISPAKAAAVSAAATAAGYAGYKTAKGTSEKISDVVSNQLKKALSTVKDWWGDSSEGQRKKIIELKGLQQKKDEAHRQYGEITRYTKGLVDRLKDAPKNERVELKRQLLLSKGKMSKAWKKTEVINNELLSAAGYTGKNKDISDVKSTDLLDYKPMAQGMESKESILNRAAIARKQKEVADPFGKHSSNKDISNKFGITKRSDAKLISNHELNQLQSKQHKLNKRISKDSEVKSTGVKGKLTSTVNALKKLSWKTYGYVALGVAGIAGVTYVAYRVYQRYLSVAAKSCEGTKGKERTACILRFKIQAAGHALAKLKEALSGCQDKSDPEGCKMSIMKQIYKWQNRINRYHKKVSKYSR